MKSEIIEAFPRKELFIDILTQDVLAKTCILDLIDNSVDSYVRHKIEDKRQIKININEEKFIINDNCGGIALDYLKENVFRFGAASLESENPTLGMYGIGLKRSIFKLGRKITLETCDGIDYSLMILNVDLWKENDDWCIPFETEKKRTDSPYTKIQIDDLNDDIKTKFSLDSFINEIKDVINSVYLLFMKDSIDFFINDEKLEPYNLLVPYDDQYKPSVHIEDHDGINIHIICFIDPSKGTRMNKTINKVGWNLFCNNRLILSNDISNVTGWIGGSSKDKSVLPKYHNIYNEFRGIVFLNANNPSKLPLNTSKSGLNMETKSYHYILDKMIITARPVIDYLTVKYHEENVLEENIEKSMNHVNNEDSFKSEVDATELKSNSKFEAPRKKPPEEDLVKIRYEKRRDIADKVKRVLKASSYKQLGEKTFDYYCEMEDIEDE